jgi:hypothetical protein
MFVCLERRLRTVSKFLEWSQHKSGSAHSLCLTRTSGCRDQRLAGLTSNMSGQRLLVLKSWSGYTTQEIEITTTRSMEA